jgi:hypothetical protein
MGEISAVYNRMGVIAQGTCPFGNESGGTTSGMKTNIRKIRYNEGFAL